MIACLHKRSAAVHTEDQLAAGLSATAAPSKAQYYKHLKLKGDHMLLEICRSPLLLFEKLSSVHLWHGRKGPDTIVYVA